MDTDKSKNEQANQNIANISLEEAHERRREQILVKKDKINKIREFISLKVKIHQLISLKRLEEAKKTYKTLYIAYQTIVPSISQEEATKLQNDISNIYSKLIDSLNVDKKQKDFTKNKNSEEEKKEKKIIGPNKVVTTDLDIIVRVVGEKGKMSLAEIQTTFNITRNLAEEWIQILADYGLVEIKYLPVGGIEIRKIEK